MRAATEATAATEARAAARAGRVAQAAARAAAGCWFGCWVRETSEARRGAAAARLMHCTGVNTMLSSLLPTDRSAVDVLTALNPKNVLNCPAGTVYRPV